MAEPLLLPVFELAEIQQFADGRVRIRVNLDQVKLFLFRPPQRLVAVYDAYVLTAAQYEANQFGFDSLVNAVVLNLRLSLPVDNGGGDAPMRLAAALGPQHIRGE
jgi:hypothetical protein